jgi:uncharacterized membrane protein
MDLLTTIVLLITIVLLVFQAILIYKEQKKYKDSIETFRNMERALRIAQNKLLDSERERTWLNNQVTIIFDDLANGKLPEHPKLKLSWDPRD